MKWWDGHAHLALIPGATERLVAAMDREGVDCTVVVGGGLVAPTTLGRLARFRSELDVTFDNLALRRECDRFPERLLPFFFGNPHRAPDIYREHGRAFFGLKLAPVIHGLDFDDERVTAWIVVAAELGQPVYVHCLDRTGQRVVDLVALAERWPAVTMILGHAGVGTMDFAAVDEIAATPSLLFETSGGFSAVIRYASEQLGPERLVFGSEYPLQDIVVEKVKAERLGLSADSLAAYAGGNLERVLS